MNIVLASQSPRRKKLLEQLKLTFDVFPSSVEEYSEKNKPSEIVQDLAYQKAKDVAQNFNDSLILGSDTIVVFEDKILGKPQNSEEAFDMLTSLSDNKHSVFTGVSLLQTDDDKQITTEIQFYEETEVYFSKLSESQIHHYIKTEKPFDKAGSYGIQDDLGATFVKKINGDFYNVVGLPLNRLYYELTEHFPAVLHND